MTRDLFTKSVITLLALPALLLPALCLIYIFWQAMPVLSLEFISTAEEGVEFGITSGILPQLTGSLLLALGACLLAAPFALGTALYYKLLAPPWQQRGLNTLLNTLQGIPPIVFGLFGLIIFVHTLQWGISLASGIVILAMVVLPLMVLNTISAIQRIPDNNTNAARSLGLSDSEVIWRVWLPQAWPNILTGLLLGMARALSETAPILFTATIFSGVQWPDSIFSPVPTLQTHIFYLAQEGSNPLAVSTAWGSAAVLIALIALFGIAARILKRIGTPS